MYSISQTETNFDEAMTTMYKDQGYHTDHTQLNYTIPEPLAIESTCPPLWCFIDLCKDTDSQNCLNQ